MTEPTDVRADLVSILEADRVLTDRADRLAYNADCSPRGILLTRGRRLDAGQPDALRGALGAALEEHLAGLGVG